LLPDLVQPVVPVLSSCGASCTATGFPRLRKHSRQRIGCAFCAAIIALRSLDDRGACCAAGVVGTHSACAEQHFAVRVALPVDGGISAVRPHHSGQVAAVEGSTHGALLQLSSCRFERSVGEDAPLISGPRSKLAGGRVDADGEAAYNELADEPQRPGVHLRARSDSDFRL